MKRPHVRVKIPKESARIVTVDEMKLLQIEAAAKLLLQRITTHSIMLGESGLSTRKSSSTSTNSGCNDPRGIGIGSTEFSHSGEIKDLE